MSNFFRDLQRDSGLFNRMPKPAISTNQAEQSSNQTQASKNESSISPSPFRLSMSKAMHSNSKFLSKKLNAGGKIGAEDKNLESDTENSPETSTNDDDHVFGRNKDGSVSDDTSDASIVNTSSKSTLFKNRLKRADDKNAMDDDDLEFVEVRDVSVDMDENGGSPIDTSQANDSSNVLEDSEVVANSTIITPAPNERPVNANKSLFGGRLNEEKVKIQLDPKSFNNMSEEENFNSDDSLKPLLNTIVSLKDKCDGLRSKLHFLNAELSNKTDKLNSSNSELSKLKSSYHKMHDMMVSLQSNISSFQLDKNFYNSNLRNLKLENETNKNQLATYRSEIDYSKKRLESFKQKFISGKLDHDKQEMEIKSLKQQIDDISGHLSEEKIRSSALSKELENARKAYDSAILKNAEHREKFEKTILDKIDVGLKQNLKAEIKEVLDVLPLQIESCKEAVKEHATGALKKISDNGKFQEKYITDKFSLIDELVKQFGTTIDGKLSKLDDLFKSADNEIALIKGLEASVTVNFNELNSITKKNALNYESIEKDISKLDEVYKENKKITEKYENRIILFQNEIEKVNTEKTTVKEQLVVLQTTNVQLNTEMSKVRSSSVVLNQELKSRDSEHSKLESKLRMTEDRLNGDLQRERSRLADIEKSLNIEKESCIKVYESQIRSHKELLSMSNDEKNRWKAQFDESAKSLQESKMIEIQFNNLKLAHQSLTSEKSILENQIIGLQNNLKNTETALKNKIFTLEREIDSIKSGESVSLKMKSQDLEKYKTKNGQLQIDLKAKKAELKSVNDRNNKLVKEISSFEFELDGKSNKFSEALINSESQVSSLQKTIIELEKSLEDMSKLSNENEKLSKEIKSLELKMGKMNTLQKKLNSESDTKASLEKEIKKLKSEMEKLKSEAEKSKKEAQEAGAKVLESQQATSMREGKTINKQEIRVGQNTNKIKDNKQADFLRRVETLKKRETPKKFEASKKVGTVKKAEVTKKEVFKNVESTKKAELSKRESSKKVDPSKIITTNSIQGKRKLIDDGSEDEFDEFSFENMDDFPPTQVRQYSKQNKKQKP